MHFLALGLFAASSLSAQQPVMTIDEFEPKSLLVVPEHKYTRAKFPFVDIHNHQNRAAGADLDRLMKDMEDINMQTMVMLGGGFGSRLVDNIERQKKKYPDRVVVFANIDFSDMDAEGYSKRAAEQIEKDFKAGAQGLKIFKNFGMDTKDSKGNRVHVDDPRFDGVFEMCAKYKAPVLIHTAEPLGLFNPMDKYNERWLELKLFPGRGRDLQRYPPWAELMAEQHRLFARHPKTIFINAHLGWLGNDLGKLGELFDRLPNVHSEIGAVLEELGRQPRFARAFLTKYKDRVLFGKDTWRKAEYGTYFRTLESADEYFDHDRKYHGIWKMYGLELSDDVLKHIYYKNAVRIVPGMDASKFPR
ncbi:MAG: amidohydrolase family protein [Candidatus Solibacter usitatus]|nr:amidohydrolase family protein [Candidatus Solibacter usitatus]